MQGFVRAVYGGSGEDEEDLERKLERSLGLQPQQPVVAERSEETPKINGNAEQSRRTRGSARDDSDDE